MLEEYGVSEEEYDDYVGHYKNVVQEIKDAKGEEPDGSDGKCCKRFPESGFHFIPFCHKRLFCSSGRIEFYCINIEIDQDYELMAYSNTKIDYEYIIHLIQNIVTPYDEIEEITPKERQKKMDEVKQYVGDLRKENLFSLKQLKHR